MFRYREDRIPVALIALYSVADLVVYFTVDSLWFLLAWVVIGIIPKANIGAWTHHHQHCFTFRSTWMNRVLESLHFFHVGISTHSWWLHHVLGHHKNYLNQKLDQSRWMREDGTTMGEWEYTLSVAATAYPRAAEVGQRNRRYLPAFVYMLVLNLSLLAMLIWFRPMQGIMVYLVPMTIGLIMIAHATYQHHAGLDTDDHFDASHNIVDPMYNLVTGNLGYHTAHHLKGGMHWSRLPKYHAKIAEKIPPELFDQPGFPYPQLTRLAQAMGIEVRPVSR